MSGRTDIHDLSAGDDFEAQPITSVEELVEILAELSERVARLERATVLLLAEKNGEALAASAEPDPPSRSAYADAPARHPGPAEAPGAAPHSGVDFSRVDFDLPAHQWGGEGNRNAGATTPIQHSDYPDIKYVDEADKPKPKRTGPPERVLVRAALEAYPHIIESVCLFWNGRECDTYLSKLVIDTRGGRRGFPQEVMDELLFLAEVTTIKSGIKPVFTPLDRERLL